MAGKKGMKKYPKEIREKIVKEFHEGKSQAQLSREYGISRYSIQSWIGTISKKNLLPKNRGRKPAKTLQEYKYENKRLKMENALLKDFLLLTERSESVGKIYKRKEEYSISEMCRFFEVSRSGCCKYLNRKDIPAKDLELADKIKECQEINHKTYGYRRVHIWLERQGIYRNPKTVLRVMQKYNLLSVVRRKKFHYCSQYLHRYPNALNRDFSANRPN